MPKAINSLPLHRFLFETADGFIVEGQHRGELLPQMMVRNACVRPMPGVITAADLHSVVYVERRYIATPKTIGGLRVYREEFIHAGNELRDAAKIVADVLATASQPNLFNRRRREAFDKAREFVRKHR